MERKIDTAFDKTKSVASLGFPRLGESANLKSGAPTCYLGQFPQNCMKMKRTGPSMCVGGGRTP